MRLVLDTNVVASALFWGGNPATLLDAAQLGEIEIFTSRPLLSELAGILVRSKFASLVSASGSSVEDLVLGYAALTTVVVPAQISLTIQADPADDEVLACALSAQADGIVSGDKHLHSLGGSYQNIKILRPAEAVTMIEGR
jgi:putative PIN family toxin of toxin-antitoxin system